MRNLRQGIRLIHELRKLRGTKELFDYSGGRLVVDQLLRHQGFDVLQAHAFLDRTLHSDQSDAELILDQFSDRAHPPISQMVDIVNLTDPAFEIDQVAHHFEDIFAAQGPLLKGNIELELMVKLEPADLREIVPFGIE